MYTYRIANPSATCPHCKTVVVVEDRKGELIVRDKCRHVSGKPERWESLIVVKFLKDL